MRDICPIKKEVKYLHEILNKFNKGKENVDLTLSSQMTSLNKIMASLNKIGVGFNFIEHMINN